MTIEDRLQSSSVEEGVFVVRDHGRFCQNDADDIEAHFAPIESGTSDERSSRSNNVPLFLRIDGAIGCAVFGGCSGFHFYEDREFTATGDDVDFRVFTWFEIAGDYVKSGTLQVPVRQVLTALA
jgi:hypothetical protein